MQQIIGLNADSGLYADMEIHVFGTQSKNGLSADSRLIAARTPSLFPFDYYGTLPLKLVTSLKN